MSGCSSTVKLMLALRLWGMQIGSNVISHGALRRGNVIAPFPNWGVWVCCTIVPSTKCFPSFPMQGIMILTRNRGVSSSLGKIVKQLVHAERCYRFTWITHYTTQDHFYFQHPLLITATFPEPHNLPCHLTAPVIITIAKPILRVSAQWGNLNF